MDKDNMNTEIEETTELYDTDDMAYEEAETVGGGDFMTEDEPEPPKPKKKFKFKKWMIIPLALVVLYAGYKILFGGSSATTVPVQTMPVAYTDITQQFSGSGKLDSADNQTIYLPTDFTATTVKTVNVKAGDTVTTGQVLATLDTTDLAYAVTQAENAYKQVWLSNQDSFANADEYNARERKVNKLKDEVVSLNNERDTLRNTTIPGLAAQKAATEAQRDDWVSQQGSYSPGSVEYDALQQQINNANAQIASIDSQILNASNRIDDIDDRIGTTGTTIDTIGATTQLRIEYDAAVLAREAYKPYYLTQAQRVALVNSEENARKAWQNAKEAYAAAAKGIVAPCDGLLTSFSAEKGGTVTGGGAVGKVGSMTDVEVALPLSKFELEILQVGQPAIITVGDKEYTGTVSRINHSTSIGTATDATAMGSGNSSSSYITAYVKLDNPPSNIFLGLEANVTVITASKTNVLAVPTTAIITDIDGTYCYVMEGEEMVQKFVKTGVSNEMMIEIISGLEEGDEVVENPSLMNASAQTGGMMMFG